MKMEVLQMVSAAIAADFASENGNVSTAFRWGASFSVLLVLFISLSSYFVEFLLCLIIYNFYNSMYNIYGSTCNIFTQDTTTYCSELNSLRNFSCLI